MNEQKRQAYLRVMDIQTYFPRQVLRGAKPSPAYDIPLDESPSPGLDELNASAEPKSARMPAARERAAAVGLEAVEELRGQTKPPRKASVTPIRKSESEAENPIESSGSATAEPEHSLSFSLRYYRISDTLAVLDEMPQQGSGELAQASRKLMQAILKALGVEFNGSAGGEEFSWPLHSGYTAKHSPQVEAARALSGFLQMRHETDDFKNLLVFAGQLEEVLLPDAQSKTERDLKNDRGYTMTVTHSLASMLAVAALKRDVWQHLQALRKRLAGND